MAGTIGAGARHLRHEWGRWWRTDDQTDTHIAHRILNDQYRLWQRIHQRTKAEVQQNIGLLKQQQKQATYMQMQRLQMQKQMRGRGYGGYGMFGMMGGSSPFISYRMMQWAQLQVKINQEEFEFAEITPGMLAVGRGQLRARRHRAAAGTLLGIMAVWGLILWASLAVGVALLALLAAVFTGMAAAAGRRPVPRRPPVPKLLFVPKKVPEHTELAEEPEPQPFPIREAGRDPRRARECVEIALRKDGAKVAEVQVPEETHWGWRQPIVLSDGTLGDLVRTLPKLATTLRVGENRLTASRTSPEDSAAVTLRILTSDPFADPMPYPERPPLSCSITRPVSIGLSLEGETTPVVLAGQHVIIVADTGGGKTAMVQALAEYVTACRDAVAVDIDPAKRGLKALSQAAVRIARTPEEAERELEQLLERARTRIASMPPTQDMWEPGPDAPAVVAFLDEFPQMSKRGKQLAVDLLRVGREAMITLVMCTQDASSDVLSDAIADVPGVRIMMPCRQADVPLVVGQSDAISRGWLPHLLVPSPEPDFPADAGRFYCITPRHRTPIMRYVSPLPPAEADRRARERVQAGLPRLDPAPASTAVPDHVPEIARLLLQIFAAESDPEWLSVAQLADHLAKADRQEWGRWDGKHNRLVMVGRTLRSHLKQAGLDVTPSRIETHPDRPTVYYLADIKDAVARLS
ncbi:ATP-binding protein [Streptomyces spirodelae]|uniref:ATP-binding protein n=1 Tax=Streptomyces spirodelae TaxID=2812904 RepID=A0ABS3X1D0_9ACTN|nr:ATP-binding protein [Streptomyces spirodelae]MBO8189191.1 ATP-binding protein [Streptomyces spirodelae]